MSESLVLELPCEAAVRREIAVLAEADAHPGVRMDRMEARRERIERRLDLVEP